MSDNRLCCNCKKRPKKKHFNSKYCKACAQELRKRPKGTLSIEQKKWIKARIGKMPVSDMAFELGTSVSNIKRSMPGVRIWFKNGKYKQNPKLVESVLSYYSKHGKLATEKAFPKISVGSIVDRAAYYGIKMKPRQIRWKESEIILAAKMAGLVDGKTQARIFNRPHAHEGSIRSLWMKKFKQGGGNIHGMSEWMARRILKPGYPVLKTRVWSPRQNTKNRKGPVRGLVLWCDMESYLLNDTPTFIRNGVRAMAKFQSWLFKTSDPKQKILEMIREAEEV